MQGAYVMQSRPSKNTRHDQVYAAMRPHQLFWPWFYCRKGLRKIRLATYCRTIFHKSLKANSAMPPSIDNTTDRPQVSPEQMQEFYAQQIFDAAVGRLATQQQRQLEPGSESDLMRHSRSIAAEMPQTIDEAYVLRLQSQLALANMAADEGDALRGNVADENNPASSRMTPSARQLASAAARLQMQDEATQSLGLVADLQVDLVRTRERMSDALSVARSRSHHSLVLLDNANAPNNDRNSDAASLDPADLAQMDDVVVGPIELELDLNDVEPEQHRQHRSAPTLRTARNTRQQEEEGEERDISEEATLLASIASLQFDLLQTRQRLIDERSFSHSRHLENAIPALEEATPEASQEFTIESVVSDQQPQEEEQLTTEAAPVPTTTPREGEVNDATARLTSLVIADAAPKTSGDSSVLDTRIRSGDPVQRRFSNQMA